MLICDGLRKVRDLRMLSWSENDNFFDIFTAFLQELKKLQRPYGRLSTFNLPPLPLYFRHLKYQKIIIFRRRHHSESYAPYFCVIPYHITSSSSALAAFHVYKFKKQAFPLGRLPSSYCKQGEQAVFSLSILNASCLPQLFFVLQPKPRCPCTTVPVASE